MARSLSAASAVALLVACACGADGQPPASPSPIPTGTTTNACAVRAAGQSGPIADPNGPFFHQMAIATTDDGATIRDPQIVLDHASVPDGTRLPDGGIGVYYVNGADGGVWFARVAGTTASPVGPISINGVARPQGVVDPDALLLPNRRVRLFYLSGLGTPGSGSTRAICVAESTDGTQFEVVATALTFGSGSMETDPSVTQLRDGSWMMAISRGQQTVLARSGDGLTFVAGETLAFGGVPEVAALDDGRVRLYVCARGIESYVSSDGARTWQREGVVVAGGTLGRMVICDPSRVAGTNLFVFKTAN
jgi:hypothetical protein